MATKTSDSWRRKLMPFFFVGFMDLFGVSMIIPLIGTHARELGASPTIAGFLGSVYGALQMISSPLVGKWSDVAGKRYSLIICLVMSAVGYAAYGIATSLLLMVLARFPTGIFKHSLNITKSYLADITPPEKQAAVFGRFNTASSIGFILGPMVSGHIAEKPGGFHLVAMITAVIFLLNSVVVWYFVEDVFSTTHPECSHHNQSSESSVKNSSTKVTFSSVQFLKSFNDTNWKNLWDVFLVRFLLGFSVIIFRSNFSLMLKMRYDTTPKTTGYMISYSGVVSALSGLLVGKLSGLYRNDARLFQHMAILQALTLLLLGFASSLELFVIGLAPLSIGTSVMRVTGTSLMMRRGSDEGTGTLMGLSQSVMSIARMTSPFLAGLLLEVTLSATAVAGSLTTLTAVLVIAIFPQDRTHPGIIKKKS